MWFTFKLLTFLQSFDYMSFPDEGYSINASYALILRLYYYHWIINDTFDNRLLVIKGIIRTVTSELWY
jgi:hypothetical protein